MYPSNTRSNFSATLTTAIICKRTDNPAHYQTIISRKASKGDLGREYINYPTFSIISKNSEVPIDIPVINRNCPENCLFDLNHLIDYLENSAYIQDIQEKYHCPGCQQKIKAEDYLVDYGYEYILQIYTNRLNFLNTHDKLKNNTTATSQLSNYKQTKIPKGIMRINIKGDYHFINESALHDNPPLQKITQIIEGFQTAKLIKYKNCMNISEEHKFEGVSNRLGLKPNYLLNFTRKIEQITRPKMSKLKRPFCFLRVSSRFDRFAESGFASNNIFLWFPKQKAGENEIFMNVSLIKDTDDYESLYFSFLAYLIKIPGVGAWLTGGIVSKIDSTKVPTDECYEINLKNLSSCCKIRCERMPNLPIKMMGQAGICVGEYIYIVGGSDGNNALTTTFKICWRDPHKEKWIKLANMTYDKFYSSLTSTTDQRKILSFGGCYNYGAQLRGSNEIEMYDIELNKWEVLKFKNADLAPPASMPFVHPISDHEFVLFGGVDSYLGTSIMMNCKLDLRKREIVNLDKIFQIPQKTTSDFTDLNAVWSKEKNTLWFLLPYRSETGFPATMMYELNYETFHSECRRKLLGELPPKMQVRESEKSNVVQFPKWT